MSHIRQQTEDVNTHIFDYWSSESDDEQKPDLKILEKDLERHFLNLNKAFEQGSREIARLNEQKVASCTSKNSLEMAQKDIFNFTKQDGADSNLSDFKKQLFKNKN